MAEVLTRNRDGQMLALHRVQGETLSHNAASRRVLESNGFETIGFAPKFLRIAGEWQDQFLHQRVNDAWTGSP